MGLVLNENHSDFARSTLGKRLYTCDAPKCDVRRVPWSESWVWYGSILDAEYDPKSILTFCSDECRKVAERMMQPRELKPRHE